MNLSLKYILIALLLAPAVNAVESKAKHAAKHTKKHKKERALEPVRKLDKEIAQREKEMHRLTKEIADLKQKRVHLHAKTMSEHLNEKHGTTSKSAEHHEQADHPA